VVAPRFGTMLRRTLADMEVGFLGVGVCVRGGGGMEGGLVKYRGGLKISGVCCKQSVLGSWGVFWGPGSAMQRL
jgi:hypothetical protein